MMGALESGFRSLAALNFAVTEFINGNPNVGQGTILPDGEITVGAWDTNHFTFNQSCGFYSFSYSFNVSY